MPVSYQKLSVRRDFGNIGRFAAARITRPPLLSREGPEASQTPEPGNADLLQIATERGEGPAMLA